MVCMFGIGIGITVPIGNGKPGGCPCALWLGGKGCMPPGACAKWCMRAEDKEEDEEDEAAAAAEGSLSSMSLCIRWMLSSHD